MKNGQIQISHIFTRDSHVLRKRIGSFLSVFLRDNDWPENTTQTYYLNQVFLIARFSEFLCIEVLSHFRAFGETSS